MTRYKERKEAGLCVFCGKPAREGKTTCAACKEKRSANYRYYKAMWLRHGLCPRCGHAIEDTLYKTCERCRRNARNHMRNTKKKGEVKA